MDAGQPPRSSSETLMAALLTVPAPRLASLAWALAVDARRLQCRLAFLLLSPPHFDRALELVRAMPLHVNAALLGRLLLRSLLLLFPALCPEDAHGGVSSAHHHYLFLPQPYLDAALLLLAVWYSKSPAAASSSLSPIDWRAAILDDMVKSALSVSGLGATPWAALAPYVDAAAKCRRFADFVSLLSEAAGNKDGEVHSGAAYAAAVMLLAPRPRSSSADGAAPCAICREEMVGHGECALRPCGHRFHWRCAQQWLARRHTCPCCRAELPSRDATVETRRLWRAVERAAARNVGT